MDGLPYRNEYVEIEPDPDHHVVVFRRTASPLPDSEKELRQLYEHIARVFDELPLEQWGLLVDGRAPRGRNDEIFERVQSEYRPRLFGRFSRVAALAGCGETLRGAWTCPHHAVHRCSSVTYARYAPSSRLDLHGDCTPMHSREFHHSLLVRTSVGALQVDRYIRHETKTFAVFGDERDARGFLRMTG